MNVLISCSRSKSIGLGHFPRMLALSKSFSKREEFNIFFSVHGDEFSLSKLQEKDLVIDISAKMFQTFLKK